MRRVKATLSDILLSASALPATPRSQSMIAASQAFQKTFGLIATFGGIGLIVNGIIVYIFVQVRGEHQQNEDYRASRSERFGS